MYLFDTDHVGVMQRASGPEFGRLVARVAKVPRSQLYTSIVTFHEQILGWNAYISRATDATGVVRGYRMFERVLEDFADAQVLPFDIGAAEEFNRLRHGRVRVGTMDLRIASIAIARRFTLLTRNVRDFSKVPGLKVEDWTA